MQVLLSCEERVFVIHGLSIRSCLQDVPVLERPFVGLLIYA